ncbi:MAG: hypothetical protein EWV82_10305 [Microcystis aeruginosa Ma_AC_P_19900807_S299]|nr:MAG: hypothetical protein EWV82_10305 [Microcystis aeruginosa Ma_AC_P_19900807_S299]
MRTWRIKTRIIAKVRCSLTKEIRTLKGHDNWVTSVNFSPDGKTLVSGSDNKTIKLWNGSISLTR